MLSPPRRNSSNSAQVAGVHGQESPITTGSSRLPAAIDFIQTQTHRIKAQLSMRRTTSEPALPRPTLDEPLARSKSAPPTLGEQRPGALKINWDAAGPAINDNLRTRYEHRKTRKVVGFAARRASEDAFQAFLANFAEKPEKALQHLIKVAADIDTPQGALDLMVSKLPATPKARQDLMDVLTGEAITNNFLRTVQAHPRLVRAALKLKRAVYLRLVSTGRATTDRHLLDIRDRAASLKALGPTTLTNTQLLIDIAFLRLNPAHRALAISALGELWSDKKDAVSTLLAEAMLKLNAKFMQGVEKKSGLALARNPEPFRRSSEKLVNDVWNETFLVSFLARRQDIDPAYARQLATTLRQEAFRLRNFQRSIDVQ